MSKPTSKQLEEYQAAFSLFDKNGDGTISVQELREAMRRLGHNPSDGDVQDMISQVDSDKNGSVDFDEFVDLMHNQVNKVDAESDMRDAFNTFDRNKDGFISPAELKSVMASMGEKLTQAEVDAMIKAADLNGDGKIDFQEFVRMMS